MGFAECLTESRGWAGSRTFDSVDTMSRTVRMIAVQSRPISHPRTRSPRRSEQRFNHKRDSLHQVALHKRRRDPQDAIPCPDKLAIPRSVVSPLLLVARVPINLNDEPGLPREEVDDVVTDNDLAPKLHTEQLTTAHEAPHERLSVSGMMTKRPSALFEKRLARGALSQRM